MSSNGELGPGWCKTSAGTSYWAQQGPKPCPLGKVGLKAGCLGRTITGHRSGLPIRLSILGNSYSGGRLGWRALPSGVLCIDWRPFERGYSNLSGSRSSEFCVRGWMLILVFKRWNVLLPGWFPGPFRGYGGSDPRLPARGVGPLGAIPSADSIFALVTGAQSMGSPTALRPGAIRSSGRAYAAAGAAAPGHPFATGVPWDRRRISGRPTLSGGIGWERFSGAVAGPNFAGVLSFFGWAMGIGAG